MKQTNYIFIGNVKHRRFAPRKHNFNYKTFMTYFDIDRVEEVFKPLTWCSLEKFNWQTFRRKDHVIDIRAYIQDKTGRVVTGKIYLLTQLACFGYCFNPISIYVIFCDGSDEIDMLVLEVTNTPWGERHHYILNQPDQIKNNIYQYSFHKVLHVSPFMTMDYSYHLKFKWSAGKMILHMESRRAGQKHFDAILSLSSVEMNNKNMMRTLIKYPLTQFKVIAAIHWQALRLWMKGIPFQTHPKKLKSPL